MIKTFCDLCDKQIHLNVPKPGSKWVVTVGNRSWEVCDNCKVKIQDSIEGLKK